MSRLKKPCIVSVLTAFSNAVLPRVLQDKHPYKCTPWTYCPVPVSGTYELRRNSLHAVTFWPLLCIVPFSHKHNFSLKRIKVCTENVIGRKKYQTKQLPNSIALEENTVWAFSCFHSTHLTGTIQSRGTLSPLYYHKTLALSLHASERLASSYFATS